MSVGDCRSCPAFAPRDSGLPKIGPLAGVITVERCAPMRFWCLFSAPTSDELVWKELVSPDSAKFLQWGTLKLFVYGYFDYTDIFSRRHRSGFAYDVGFMQSRCTIVGPPVYWKQKRLDEDGETAPETSGVTAP